MDELTLLRSLRDDIAEPSAERLAPAFAKLDNAMHDAASKKAARPPRPRHPIRWAAAGLSVAAAAAAAIVIGGVIAPPHPEVASAAAIVLRETAKEALSDPDPLPIPGQYFKFEVRSVSLGNWTTAGDTGGEATRGPEQRGTMDLYIPANLDDEWVQTFDFTRGQETRRGAGGSFYGARPQSEEVRKQAEIPTGSAQETLAYFDKRYSGGGSSRDADNFRRIVDVLQAYPVPSLLRARLLEAIALIPGTVSTPGVANLDGTVGVAIGRAESAGSNGRTELIVDPSTGQLIGMRDSAGSWLTAMSTTVVDSAP